MGSGSAAVPAEGTLPDRRASVSTPESIHLAALLDAQQGRYAKSVRRLERAIRMRPDSSAWQRDLGAVRLALQDWGRAASAFTAALRVDARDAVAWRGLARACLGIGETDRAFEALTQSLDFDSDSKWAHQRMAEIYRQANRNSRARRHQEEAYRLDPEDLELIARLAVDCWKADDVQAAIEHSRTVVDRHAAPALLHSFYLYWLLFDPEQTGSNLRTSCEEWFRRHCSSGGSELVVTDADPERRLRIGYLSGEFTAGPPVYFLAPIIAGHARDEVEVFLYHTSPKQDTHTEWFRSQADCWRDCSGLTADERLQIIRADRIDILIDPSGYSCEQNLAVLHRRAAPVQINYPNYPSTRGIPEIDFILTDRWLTPDGTEDQYSETPLRLTSGCITYFPTEDAPAVAPLPYVRNGFITYGLFQRRVKINDSVLDTVAAVLRRVGDARLLIQNSDPALDDRASESHAVLLREFLSRGVRESRISFVGERTRHEVMATMTEADIALDSFPFAGHTTTCECLWMGTPVVTLASDTHASRVGASILNSVGLGHFVAHSEEEYVDIAVRASADIRNLAELRNGMRDRLHNCGFTGERLVRELESELRQLWRCWCKKQTLQT